MKRAECSSRFLLLTAVAAIAGPAGCARSDAPASDPPAPAYWLDDGAPYAVDLDLYLSPQLRGGGQDPDLALAMALSGGGHRAANFGVGVMLGLEAFERGGGGGPADLLRQVDYFSTVSGGGFAAAAYFASLADHLRSAGGYEGYSLAREMTDGLRRELERGYHWPIAVSIFNPLVWLTSVNRGDYLQRRIDDRFGRYRDGGEWRTLGLRDWFIAREGDAARVHAAAGYAALPPMHVANGTLMGNSAVFPFAPGVLARYGVTRYRHRAHLFRDDLEAGVDGDALTRDDATFDLPWSVAIKASASFPLLIAPTKFKAAFPGEPPNLHVEDGGVAENLGYETALSLLAQSTGRRKVLIVVDAHRGDASPYARRGGSLLPVALVKLMYSGKAGRHRDIRQKIAREAERLGAGVVYISLNSLRAEGVDPRLYERAMGAMTSFNLSKRRQDDLIRAGVAAVGAHRDEIEALIFGAWAPPPGSRGPPGRRVGGRGDRGFTAFTRGCDRPPLRGVRTNHHPANMQVGPEATRVTPSGP